MATNLPPMDAGTESGTPCAKQARPRRWRRRVTLLLFLVLAAWSARFVYLRLTVMPTPRPEYWEAKILALDPAGERAATPQEVWSLLWSRPWEADEALKALGDARNAGWRTASEVFRGEWNKDREDIVVVNRIMESPAFRESRDRLLRSLERGWRSDAFLEAGPVSVSAPSILPWVNWLNIHARCSQHRDESMEPSITDWLACLRLGRESGRCRRTEDQKRRSLIQEWTVRQMLLTATEPHGPVDTAALARQVDALCPPEAKLSEMLEGERLVMHARLEQVFAREGGDWLVVSEVPRSDYLRGLSSSSAPRYWNLASPLFHDLATARRDVDDYFASLDRCACLVDLRGASGSSPASGRRWLGLSPGPLDGIGTVWSEMADLWPDGCFWPYYQGRSATEAALAMLALAEYQRVNGTYPAALAELVPRWLPRVPIDYADLKPLRYQRLERGFLLYSIGGDGKDDGGRGVRSPSDSYPMAPDVVFSQVKRPERSSP